MKKLLTFILFLLLVIASQAQWLNTRGIRPTGNMSDTTAISANDGRMWYDFSTKQWRVNRNGTNYTLSTGSGISGLTTNRIPYATSSTTLGDDDALTWNSSTNHLSLTTDNFGVRAQASLHNFYIGVTGGIPTPTGIDNFSVLGGQSLSTGDGNINIGVFSGQDNETGSYNLNLGYQTNLLLTDKDNNITMGRLLEFTTDASNQLNIQNAIFGTGNAGTGTTISTGNIGLYVQSPTARLHLPAGTTAAGTAPLKLTTGTAMTTPEDGALEYHGSHLYFTIGSTRYQLDQQGGGSGWALTGTSTLTGGVTIAQDGNDILFHNGNILFGPTSSTITANTKVDIRGTGTGSGTTALRIANSSNSDIISFRDDRAIVVSTGATMYLPSLTLIQGTTGTIRSAGQLYLQSNVTTVTPPNSIIYNFQNINSNALITSGTTHWIRSLANYAPTSGTGNWNMYTEEGTINQTGGANGNVKVFNITPTFTAAGGSVTGFDYNPTVTSITGTHLAYRATSGSVLIGGTSLTADALLDLQSTTKAFIPPRMTTTQRDAIASPSAGMIIYNTTTNVLNFYNGSSWGAI